MNMLAAAANTEHPLAYMGVVDTAVVALLGYAVVFVGLIALMVVVMIMGKAFVASANKKKAAKTTEPAPVVAAPVVAEPQLAPGTAGELKLHDVNPKTAAMLMAIVADKMGKPLNELRFISIKEVK